MHPDTLDGNPLAHVQRPLDLSKLNTFFFEHFLEDVSEVPGHTAHKIHLHLLCFFKT